MIESTTKCELVVIADEGGWFDTPISEWSVDERTYRGLAVSLAIPCGDIGCEVCYPDEAAA